MATSTDSEYYWYIRKGPRVDTIGIVGADGDAVDSSLTVELRGEISDEDRTFNDDDNFDLPEEFLLPFIGGVAFELGVYDTIAYKVYNDAQRLYRGKRVSHKYAGARLTPSNLRGDKFTNIRSERDA